jgi:hypothetical protein
MRIGSITCRGDHDLQMRQKSKRESTSTWNIIFLLWFHFSLPNLIRKSGVKEMEMYLYLLYNPLAAVIPRFFKPLTMSQIINY